MVAAQAALVSVVQGNRDTGNLGIYSNEEKRILRAAPPDASSAITIYWVACAGMDAFYWKDDGSLHGRSYVGWAGKAMMSSRNGAEDPYPRVIWLADFGQQRDGLLWIVAHELGHALGDMGHTIDRYEVVGGLKRQTRGDGFRSGFAPDSDNCLRLMTGLVSYRHPKTLNKQERDWIATFEDYTQ